MKHRPLPVLSKSRDTSSASRVIGAHTASHGALADDVLPLPAVAFATLHKRFLYVDSHSIGELVDQKVTLKFPRHYLGNISGHHQLLSQEEGQSGIASSILLLYREANAS